MDKAQRIHWLCQNLVTLDTRSLRSYTHLTKISTLNKCIKLKNRGAGDKGGM